MRIKGNVPSGSVASRKGGNGGYSQRQVVKDTMPRKPMKQNIGRDGSVKAPKS